MRELVTMEHFKLEKTPVLETTTELVREAGRASISEPKKSNLLAWAIACQVLAEAPDPDLRAMQYLAARVAKSHPWLTSARKLTLILAAK